MKTFELRKWNICEIDGCSEIRTSQGVCYRNLGDFNSCQNHTDLFEAKLKIPMPKKYAIDREKNRKKDINRTNFFEPNK